MVNISNKKKWLEWAQEIQSLAQTGNTYAEDHFQRQRYNRLLEIAAEIVSEHSGLSVDTVFEKFQVQPGYATPKVDVRGAVFQNGKLLMVHEKRDGGWTMPGGWADVGDYPAAAAEREVLEESGFHVKARKLIGVYDANRVEPLDFYHAYKLVFLCDLVAGTARMSDETNAVAFFAADDIPRNFAGERTQARHVWDAFAVLSDQSIPTVYD
jgi:ADP-ribose pyrophosphatase YjhB (NUDIX family)